MRDYDNCLVNEHSYWLTVSHTDHHDVDVALYTFRTKIVKTAGPTFYELP